MLVLLVLAGSIVIASFFGHAIHWALHQRWSGVFNRAHLEHHEVHYPAGKLVSDKYLASKWYHSGPLLFTPPLLIILGTFGGLLWWAGAPHWAVAILGVTLVGFGLVNDWFHDSMHVRKHPLLSYRWYRQLRKLHFLHHHDMGANFGVVSFVWDRVFGTKRINK